MPATITQAYQEARSLMAGVDWTAVARRMGTISTPEGMQVAFFGEPHWIGPEGCTGPHGRNAAEAVGLVLCRYVQRFPAIAPNDGAIRTFRELEGAGPLVSRFADNTHKIIASTFGRDPDALRNAALALRCRQEQVSGFDLALRFDALTHVPLYLHFNAADSEFPAQAVLLFHPTATVFLDLQALFIVATYLTGRLIGATGRMEAI
jgi:hypothetical protein